MSRKDKEPVIYKGGVTYVGYPEPDRGPLQVLSSPKPAPEPEPEAEAEP